MTERGKIINKKLPFNYNVIKYVMTVESFGRRWEMYIAPYDMETIQKLTGIRASA